MSLLNPLLLCDSYKLGHADQYPVGTQYIYSNFTPRSLKLAGNILGSGQENEIVMFGLQAVLKQMNVIWRDGFFARPKKEAVGEFIDFIKTNGYVVEEDALLRMEGRVSELHDFGRLPIKVNALKEGSLLSVKTPVLTIVNTDERFYWITNYLETWLSANLWKVMTSATISRQYRKIIEKYAKLTGLDKDETWSNFIDWQGHDFSMRGMSGVHDAQLTGLGHLISFKGSDSLVSAKYAQEVYGTNLPKDYIFASSIPATEHSVMCMGSAYFESEKKLFKHLITQVYPNGLVSLVSDTWDYWKVLTQYTKELKETILNRNGKLVIRPDSGNPVHIVAGYRIYWCGTKDDLFANANVIYHQYQVDNQSGKFVDDKCVVEVDDEFYELTNEGIFSIEKHIVEGSIETLWHIFGGTENVVDDKTYRTLDSHIGLIYGDSITLQRCEAILSRLYERGFSSANIVFGIGSYTYNYHTRDTLGFAMKATYGVVNGKGFNIYKDPVTDKDKMKKSATGLLKVIDGQLYDKVELQDNESILDFNQGELLPVFENGVFLREYNFEEIRQRIKESLK